MSRTVINGFHASSRLYRFIHTEMPLEDIDHDYPLEADEEIPTIRGAGSRITPEGEYRLLFMLVTSSIMI